ncbi:MAG: bacillithiol biosynthesis BshC, partial [Gemmatimonadaceae bacterium]|nr:bacillithiol biosynthesis BshC [Gemmatimonadaceae bacterium]
AGRAVRHAGHDAVLAEARALCVRALREAPAVDAALRAREREIAAHGYDPTVAHVNGLSLVFDTTNGARRRIPIAVAAAAADDPATTLEANVLLRPVAERAVLPSVAYVAGPSEIAYFAQTSAVAAALGATMPIVVPRWSGVIVEPHIRRILDRYGLAPDDLRDPHAALGRLARERLPREVRDALARYRAALEESAARLARAIAAEEHPLLPDAVPEGARRSIQHRLDRLERRVVAAAKRREEELVRDLDTARAALFPLGKPQERVLNLIPMLARHGPPLLDAMLERAREHAAQFAPQGAARSVAAFDHAGDHR